MDSSKEDLIIKYLEILVEMQKDQLKLLNNIYRTFSKYDSEYLNEMEREGFKPPQQ